MKYLSLIFALLFVLFAAVQYNDPDPQIWVPIYAFAAMACIMAYTRVGRPWFFWLMALVYAGAAIWQWPPAFEGFLLNEMSMKTINIELARESGGLAICALGMGLMAWLVGRRG
jgi:hypothetical protein